MVIILSFYFRSVDFHFILVLSQHLPLLFVHFFCLFLSIPDSIDCVVRLEFYVFDHLSFLFFLLLPLLPSILFIIFQA